VLYCLLIILSFATFACGTGKNDEKIAEIDGIAVTRTELNQSGGKILMDIRAQLYRAEKQKLDELITQKILAREAQKIGVSVATLVEQEVYSKVTAVTEDEIETLYKNNKERIPLELKDVRSQIAEILKNQKIEIRKSQYLKSLKEASRVVTYLKPPSIYRVDIAVRDSPFKGPPGAPITIIKFEDFQCPFCKQAQPTLVELLKRYDGKVRVVHKDLPLDSIHSLAHQSAEAARCAGEQGKFWNYHDVLYANSSKLRLEDLKGYASEIGLDVESFRACYNSGKFKPVVQNDLITGSQLGITGTPTFFINGRELSGAQPLEAFAAIIDEELARLK